MRQLIRTRSNKTIILNYKNTKVHEIATYDTV